MTFAADPHTEDSAHIPGVDQFAHFLVYRLPDGSLDRLGAGAMGVTYRARDTLLDRDVALKIINHQFVQDEHLRERFFREAKAAALLQHPHIASALYRGEEAGVCFYVMELVPGEDLEAYIERVGPLEPRHALYLAHQIALALDAAYRSNLLHRDLKPGNIMLAGYHDNRNPHVKVIDFGLAKFAGEMPSSHLTQNGLVGTPGFASPEHWEGLKIDHRSDLYSLGATLWFLLTGKPPYEGNLMTVLRAQAKGEPALDGLDTFPLPLQHLLLRLLSSTPDGRPATPLEAADALQAVMDSLEYPAEPAPSRSTPARQQKRRASKRSWIAAATLCLALFAGLLGFFFQVRLSSGTSPEPATGVPTAPKEFTNSLGMRFIEAPGVPGLVSIWETRVRDFAAFIQDTGDPGAANLPPGYIKWDQPGFSQTPDDPVVHVSSEDAVRFCRWLTQKERDAGIISKEQSYRLPTSVEFSKCIADFSEPAFFWGATWPPPDGFANFADVETKKVQFTFQTIEDYRDGFSGTAPAGSFPKNKAGLHDLIGNVWEITRDIHPWGVETTMQGAGWTSFQPAHFRDENRVPIQRAEASGELGFRCMLVEEPLLPEN